MRGLGKTAPPSGVMPVGSIYLSLTTDNPTNLFGGTWERIKDTFLLAAGDTYALGNKGGASTHAHTTAYHTLTINEIPSHKHAIVKYIGMVNNTAAFGINDSNFDGLVASDVMSSTVNSVAVTEAQKDTIMANTGGSQGHNHGDTYAGSSMPPYLAVYIWKRVS